MLLGPAMDTFEARADCRANKLALTRERERTVLRQAMYLAPWSHREIFVQAGDGALL